MRPRSIGPARRLLLLAAGCAVGCAGSERLNPVEGTVLHKKEPLVGALVTFHPKKGASMHVPCPVGLTDDAGRFRVTTGDKAGAPAGEYVVTLIQPKEVTPKRKKQISTAPPDSADALGGSYADPKKSTIVVEVKTGVNKLEPFHLK
jgi:hypothetical protein